MNEITAKSFHVIRLAAEEALRSPSNAHRVGAALDTIEAQLRVLREVGEYPSGDAIDLTEAARPASQ